MNSVNQNIFESDYPYKLAVSIGLAALVSCTAYLAFKIFQRCVDDFPFLRHTNNSPPHIYQVSFMGPLRRIV